MRRKRMRLTQNTADHHDSNSDGFSRLTDDILLSILSRLPLKDAAATNGISRRWRYLWRQTFRLNIDNDKRLKYVRAPTNLRLIGRKIYINWVNRVIRQHAGLKLEYFRIHYDLDRDSKADITRWIKFAISKKVENLVLDLSETSDYRGNHEKNYIFPNDILDDYLETFSLRQKSIFNDGIMPSTEVPDIMFLKALTLRDVNVSDETISKILKTRRALEYLSIFNSSDMERFRMSGMDLKLTTLEIVLCPGLRSIGIYNSNIKCFTYLGPVVGIKLDDLPRLERLSIGGLGSTWMGNYSFKDIPGFLNLQVLELNFRSPKENMEKMHRLLLPEMPNVKQLIVMTDARENESLQVFTWVIRACPNLKKFVIRLSWMQGMNRRMRKRYVIIEHLHQHLEMVEIAGYYGRMSDFELALYFFHNGIALKKMVIDPHDQHFKRPPISETLMKREARYPETVKEKEARSRAQRWLVPEKPPHVELVIL